MDRISIHGGKKLYGVIRLSGAKNAALPIMAASLLTEEILELINAPHLVDIRSMQALLGELGVMFGAGGQIVPFGDRAFTLQARQIKSVTAPYDLVRRMRASVLVLGPLLAREGEAIVSLPGGCAIGARPIDFHLDGLRAMGAEISLRDGYARARAPIGGLRGAEFRFSGISVGATENLIMAACLARGTTILDQAATEPEIDDLIVCLTSMGAEIEWIGSRRLRIAGKERLGGARHSIIPDRIEAGTYAIAAALTGGEIILQGAPRKQILETLAPLAQAGVEAIRAPNGVLARRHARGLSATTIETSPHPGFPTDLQAQYMTLAAITPGTTIIKETIFENRFMHVPELCRLGASIAISGATAQIIGTGHLLGAAVMATDLRASVSLVLAGLAAIGETVINRVYHLDRGYAHLEYKLAGCGAEIGRIRGNQDDIPVDRDVQRSA